MATNGPSLREYIEALFKSHETAHEAHAEGHEREHNFAQKAIDKAAELGAQNKADANEWRAAMTDRERTFATRIELDAVKAEADKLADAEIRRAENERITEKAQTRSQWLISIAVGAIAILVNIVIRVMFQ